MTRTGLLGFDANHFASMPLAPEINCCLDRTSENSRGALGLRCGMLERDRNRTLNDTAMSAIAITTKGRGLAETSFQPVLMSSTKEAMVLVITILH